MRQPENLQLGTKRRTLRICNSLAESMKMSITLYAFEDVLSDSSLEVVGSQIRVMVMARARQELELDVVHVRDIPSSAR